MTGPSYRGRRLDGTLREFHAAVDLLDAHTVPENYWRLVVAANSGRLAPRKGAGAQEPAPAVATDQLALTVEAPPAQAGAPP